MEFNLAEFTKGFQEADRNTLTVSSPEDKLMNITDMLALTPDAVAREDVFDSVNDLCLGYGTLEEQLQNQLVYIICTSAVNQAENTQHIVDISEIDLFFQHRKIIEIYGYLLNILLTYIGEEDISACQAVGTKKPSVAAIQKFKNNCKLIEECFNACCAIFKIKLKKLFETTPELDLYVSLFTRPAYSMMESEQRVKVQAVRIHLFTAICLAIKYQGHGSAAQGAIIQNLTYFTHLTGSMAELLQLLATNYDCPQLTEETLQEVSNKQFSANDTNGPKSISQFITRLSELLPDLVLKQMMSIGKLLDNSAHQLRCSVVEACGNIIVNICSKEESLQRHRPQVEKLLDLVQERFADQNPFVRTKAVQGLIKVAELEVKFIPRRQIFTDLAVRSLDDKSSLVRRNAIKLMSKLVMSHPFSTFHGSSLDLKTWKKRLGEARRKLESLTNADVPEDPAQPDMSLSNVSSAEINGADLIKVKLTMKYYEEAIRFIESIEKGAVRASKLLHSRNKNEVLEAMDFFVLADAYDVSKSKVGVKRMLHLVWMKGTNDDGTSITNHLFECYKNLFLTAPHNSTAIEAAAYVAKNLISLTYQTSVSDLASLEKLLSSMYEDEFIDNTVVKILWQIYNNSIGGKGVSKKQRRGAIIILGMISLANHEVTLRYIDSLLNVGFPNKKIDDMILAKYTCIALQRVVPAQKSLQNKDSTFRISKEKEALEKLSNCLVEYTEDPEWYPLAEQALNAVYSIASHPDVTCTDILKKKIKSVFENDEDIVMQTEEEDVSSSNKSSKKESKTIALSQLLFMVGHIAIKTMVLLEKCEAEFKKKKIEEETENAKNKKQNQKEEKDELEMIGGTSEDDFADAVIYIKERELLYGESSLLAKFGPMVKEICSNNVKYDSLILQRSAVLCMEKLMCVSSRYCEENLTLLITLMEKSPDPIIRSNAVLGLGDMAVCFNNLVDENTDYLYRRLNDDNIMVQRTCLMTVTFLILAGQVKVKGQLAMMAKCLENADHGISDMCRLFFTELATKDNAIYNGFIDIFSGLSNDSDLAKDSMKRILRFLIAFIEKEKQQKQLSEKLFIRLNKASTEEEWKDVAFVLQTLPVKSDKVTAALNEGYKMVGVRN
ncbi:condensin subunit [Saccharomycopsis crataegensis]|uniref:Condensin complex subunit 1 n=1 Tax=Saccharomycopsis crataegensis TaxID=43959 RepID=A0AAV5QE15_9ASCO|nr:condensin subunit [Saccharomycopsis crataegensis]